ncbi:zinc-finger protein [Entomophthora muscae]|uniref:Zinc-finger protein n=1 Tax=Entomophthora muscae TaxID=34485 RepID=A0ACC2U7R4_9FUNG|nr:zinc-finger protein [Entomophthora muscae]
MTDNNSPPPQLRLDFICNIDIPNSPTVLAIAHPEYSQEYSHFTSHASPQSDQQYSCYPQSKNFATCSQSSSDPYSRSCVCCGSVHYFYPDLGQSPQPLAPPTSETSSSQSGYTLNQNHYYQENTSQQVTESFYTLVKSDNPLHLSSLTAQPRPPQMSTTGTLTENSRSLRKDLVTVEPTPQNSDSEQGTSEVSQNSSEVHSENYSTERDTFETQDKETIRCMWAACSAEFGTADDLIPHLSRFHLGGRGKDSKCKWRYCNEYQPGTDELLKHLYGVHLGIEQVKLTCQWENCKSQYSSFDDLTSHLSEGHVGSGRSYYICGWSRCQRAGRPFNQRQKVMRHLQAHTGDKPYMCMVCEKRFAQSTVMSQHLRTHTGEKPFKCPVSNCGKGFSIAGSLTGHLRTHSGEKPFSCKFQGCDRQFSNSSNLTKHSRTHTGERPFRCHNDPPCPKRFARPDQAARHMKVHNTQA